MVRPYLGHMINDHKTQGKWKSKLTMTITFSCSKDSEETLVMYRPSDNIQVMKGIETDKIIEGLFDSFLRRNRKGLEGSMTGSEFAFDSVDSLYYKLHKISLNRGGSYIDFRKWLKNIKTIINPKSNDKCFQYAKTVGLNHEKINKYPQRMRKTKPFLTSIIE